MRSLDEWTAGRGPVSAGGVRSDVELLAEFALRQDEGAFEELVRRHSGFVYSSALRQVGNEAEAEEIAQAVFIVLARKAGSLKGEVTLAGWLFRAVRYAVLDAHKIEARRRKREKEAALMDLTNSGHESIAEELTPLIDEALAELSDKDRGVILERFFGQKSFREIGDTLGTNENAARARVVRALERLRGVFRRKGVEMSEDIAQGALNYFAAAPVNLGGAIKIDLSAGPALERAEALTRRLGRAERMAKVRRVGGVALGVILLLLTWLGYGIASQAMATRQIQKTVARVDAAFSFDDGNGFLAGTFLRREDERFGVALTNYVHAAAIFRGTAQRLLETPEESFRVFELTLRGLLAGQQNGTELVMARDKATAPWLPPYSLALIKVDGVWKWDYFALMNPEMRAMQMESLVEKTRALEGMTEGVRKGELSNAKAVIEEALESVAR